MIETKNIPPSGAEDDAPLDDGVLNIVGGFYFYRKEDAELASQEEAKIAYLDSRLDYNNPGAIYAIYQKAIRERTFRTPVGMQYLKHLQEYLLSRPELAGAKIPPIPLWMNFDGELRAKPAPARVRIQPPKPEKQGISPLAMSVILNIAMVIAIAAMFVITFNSDQPNILNYETALQNKYSAWEEELTEREQMVREKELELGIDE